MAKGTVKVRMPDGSVVTLPAGLSEQDMKTLLMAEPQMTVPWTLPNPSRGAVAGDAAVRGLGNAALNAVPGLMEMGGKGLAHLTAGARTLGAAPRLAMGGQSIPDFYNAAAAQEKGRGVAGGLQSMPRTSVTQAQAFLQPGDTAENYERLIDMQLEGREQYPGLFGARGGDLLGDAAALALTRAPFQRGLRNKRAAETLAQKTAPPKQVSLKDYAPGFTGGLRKELDAIWNSKLAEKTRRGFMRAGETGLEGAYIAMLNDSDPVETAAWAAGTQTVGSLLMTASGTKTGLGLTAAAAIGMTFHQMLKDATPGGKDYILESIETSYQHLTALLIAGGMATIAGMGRAPARFQQNMPEIADMLTAVPRGGVLSFISEMNDPRKDTETMELVYSQLARDPNYFGPTAARRLDRAARVEDVSIEDTINNLMEVPKFRRQVDELQQRRQADRERAVRESVNQMVPQQQPTVDSLPPSPIPQGANPLGVPEDVIMGAVSRAEQVPQGQAMANAEMAMSQQVADRILKSLDANPGKVPKEKEAQIRRLLADRNAVTPQTLEEINALLRSD